MKLAFMAALMAALLAPACAQIDTQAEAEIDAPTDVMSEAPRAPQPSIMPAETVTPDAFVAALDGARIRMFYQGIGQDFLFELQDRDVANLFSYGFPPAGRSIGQSDIVVVVGEDWRTLVAAWEEVGISAVSSSIRPYANFLGMAPHVSVTGVTAPDGHTIRVYNFLRVAEGELQSERCMARMVIHDTYVGFDASTFNSFACSREMR
jgi:hypothetical protein